MVSLHMLATDEDAACSGRDPFQQRRLPAAIIARNDCNRRFKRQGIEITYEVNIERIVFINRLLFPYNFPQGHKITPFGQYTGKQGKRLS